MELKRMPDKNYLTFAGSTPVWFKLRVRYVVLKQFL